MKLRIDIDDELLRRACHITKVARDGRGLPHDRREDRIRSRVSCRARAGASGNDQMTAKGPLDNLYLFEKFVEMMGKVK